MFIQMTRAAALAFFRAGWGSPASPADANEATRNVLFIVADDLRASVLGCYGDPRGATPNIDALAEEGMLFERAYCQGLACAPSRTSFMFSRYRGEGPVNWAQHFRENGWYTARVGKIYHMKVPGDIILGSNGRDVESSWTERFNSAGPEAHTLGNYACLNLDIFTRAMRGRETTAMPNRMFVTVEAHTDGSQQPDYKTASKAIELLREHRDEPFVLAVGMVRPHYPMVAPEEYFEPFPWNDLPLPASVENDLDDIPRAGLAARMNSNDPIGDHPDNQKRMWAGYYAATKFMDAQVGRVLDEVDRLGLRETTTIVFTSDQGYHLGEHGFWQKANLHEQATRVPLIIAAPGMEPGRTASFAELVDLFPTLTELAGLAEPGSVQGRSLVPVLDDPKSSVRESALSIWKGGYAVRTDNLSYMRYEDGSEELYDMSTDPHQFTNLALDPDHDTSLRAMRQLLQERLVDAELAND